MHELRLEILDLLLQGGDGLKMLILLLGNLLLQPFKAMLQIGILPLQIVILRLRLFEVVESMVSFGACLLQIGGMIVACLQQFIQFS